MMRNKSTDNFIKFLIKPINYIPLHLVVVIHLGFNKIIRNELRHCTNSSSII